MKNTYRILLLLLAVLIITSCSDSSKMEVIHQAEQIVQEQPDSALILLQGINRQRLSGEPLARYALIYSMAQDKSGLDVCSDSLLRIAYEYYTQHPDDFLYARCQYYMGLYYGLVDSTKQAEDCLRGAVRCAKKQGDYHTQYLALCRLSREVRYGNASLGLKYSKQALSVYIRNCPTNIKNLIILLRDIGEVFILCNREDSALYYMNKALQEAELQKDSSLIAGIMQDKSLVYTKLKDCQQALSYAKEAWRISPDRNISLVSRLANCYAAADSAEQSKDLYIAIIKVASYEHKYIAYKHLSVIEAKEHNDSMSMLYLDSAYECMEAIYAQQLKTKAAYFNNVLQLEEDKLQKEQEINKKKQII